MVVLPRPRVPKNSVREERHTDSPTTPCTPRSTKEKRLALRQTVMLLAYDIAELTF